MELEQPSVRVLYRFEDSMDHSHVTVIRREFVVIKETPKGFWFLPEWIANVMPGEYQKKHRRWVSKDARKRYCYPTKAEAWASYLHRKQYHLSRLRQQLELTEKRVNALNAREADDVPEEKELRLAFHGLTLYDY